ncbi:MAG: indole-3-glycerol phosphate synthase TrpC [Prevotella sp.]|nr:indole-3-glycerol phosphate synthase TrpC [Prevotella sp.]
MTDILNDIVAHKRKELMEIKQRLPYKELLTLVERKIDNAPIISMRQALLDSPTGIIAEFKRKSPSKGWINKDASAEVVPMKYQQNGATAISILTDSHFFGGDDAFITVARESGVSAPVLYKNFVIDEYQLLQARLCGASAVLLIAADLSKNECRTLLNEAHQLQLEVLLEMHGEEELHYAELEPDMFGINNRNLGSFVTDVQNSFRLAEKLPKGACWVSESGISNPLTVKQLREVGYRGFLIGEQFMKMPDPGLALKQFIQQLL